MLHRKTDSAQVTFPCSVQTIYKHAKEGSHTFHSTAKELPKPIVDQLH